MKHSVNIIEFEAGAFYIRNNAKEFNSHEEAVNSIARSVLTKRVKAAWIGTDANGGTLIDSFYAFNEFDFCNDYFSASGLRDEDVTVDSLEMLKHFIMTTSHNAVKSRDFRIYKCSDWISLSYGSTGEDDIDITFDDGEFRITANDPVLVTRAFINWCDGLVALKESHG